MTVYETADPGVIVAEYDAHGTVTSTGRPYQLRYVQVVNVRDSQITLWRDYWDPLASAELLRRNGTCCPVTAAAAMTDRGAPGPAAAAGIGPVLVTGATGTTGRHLTRLMRERGARVREASRHPGPGAGAGTSVFFDWGDPATYPAALDGISGLYLLRPPRAADAMPLIERFLAAARAAGVRRIVLLHSMVAGPAGMPEIRQAVEESAPEYAILQPSWFMQNFTGTHPTAITLRERGEIATATGDGRIGFIDARDIAAAAASALLAPDPPNTRYVLTGPQAVPRSRRP